MEFKFLKNQTFSIIEYAPHFLQYTQKSCLKFKSQKNVILDIFKILLECQMYCLSKLFKFDEKKLFYLFPKEDRMLKDQFSKSMKF